MVNTNRSNLADMLYSVKAQDHYINSVNMPQKTQYLNKVFAKVLGESSGKMLSTYHGMIQSLVEGESLAEVTKKSNRSINRQSKVRVKIPLSEPKSGRICGLVAIKHASFMNAEASLYSGLINDIGEADINSEDDLFQKIRTVVRNNSEKYSKLLEAKRQTVYDFGLLMGTIEDPERFDDLAGDMHKGIVNYFRTVAKLHKGNRFNITWPLPFKNFSEVVEKGLYNDTISFIIQDELGPDFGFSNPLEKSEEYSNLLTQIKEVMTSVSGDNKTFLGKWKMARALPLSLYFMSGVQVYAAEVSENGNQSPEILGPALTAYTTVNSLSDDVNDHNEFLTTWFTTFTTLL